MDPTAAPVDLTINGVNYKAYPLRDRDHEEYNKWVRREYLKRIRESTDDQTILKIAARDASTMVWMQLPGREVAIMTIAGMAKLASLLCRATISEDDMMSREALDVVMEAFRFLHDTPESDKKSATDSGADEDEGKLGN